MNKSCHTNESWLHKPITTCTFKSTNSMPYTHTHKQTKHTNSLAGVKEKGMKDIEAWKIIEVGKGI